MKVLVSLFVDRMRRRFASLRMLVLLLAVAMEMNPGLLRAQENAAKNPDPQTLQLLLQRIDQLEARVRQLEAARTQASATSSAEPHQEPAPPAPVPSEAAQANPA